MFINPMWDHESQRIGKRKCTPVGYTLHVVSDLAGFIALLGLLGTSLYLAYLGIRGEFHGAMLWLLVVPFAIAVAGNLLHSYSWYLAGKRQFAYDHEKCLATWVDEQGQPQSYKYGVSDNKNSLGTG